MVESIFLGGRVVSMSKTHVYSQCPGKGGLLGLCKMLTETLNHKAKIKAALSYQFGSLK